MASTRSVQKYPTSDFPAKTNEAQEVASSGEVRGTLLLKYEVSCQETAPVAGTQPVRKGV